VQIVVDEEGRLPTTSPAYRVPVFFDGPDLLDRIARWSAQAPPQAVDGVRGLINIDSAKGGGTGTQADWHRVAIAAQRLPIMLAGGLNPDNVREAIARVEPRAVDVSSGVERSPRQKDHAKLHAFVKAAKSATSRNP
jgi:phosphoribosylanthranilate isomerase